ncbi:MAG TPA: nucleotidyltransferase domain-containing protein [Thermoanaerobaculia bacterium]|nr:nucleotidyltransferase domain-containing protein [Thermoanaerobaculia bacterium]
MTAHSSLETKVSLPYEEIAKLCREYDVSELCVFGSVLRDDFTFESDIDFLVTFRTRDLGPWAGKLEELREKLSQLIGREVDLVEKRAVEAGANYIRRRHILTSARPFYVAG